MNHKIASCKNFSITKKKVLGENHIFEKYLGFRSGGHPAKQHTICTNNHQLQRRPQFTKYYHS